MTDTPKRPSEHDIVYRHYRGDYEAYRRDVRLAAAVKDKYRSN